MKLRSTNRMPILIGVITLFVGSFVYLIDRPPDSTYFVYSISKQISLHNILPSLFGPISKNLPAFIHVLSFSLITAGLLSCKKRGCLIVCLGWFLTDCVFELGQKFDTWFSKIIPDFFVGIPVLANSKAFFLKGAFDVYDLLATAVGAMTAYLVFLVTMRRRYPSC